MSIVTDSNLGNYFPSWTTSTRPSFPSSGQTGFNTTLNAIEVYNGTSWVVGGIPDSSTSGNLLTSDGTKWNSSGFWTVTTIASTSSISSGTTTYTLPSGAMLVTGTGYHPSGSSRLDVNIKNSGGATLFTYYLTGYNENSGGQASTSLSSRGDFAVAIPASAQGGTLDFFKGTGGSTITLTINQVITYG